MPSRGHADAWLDRTDTTSALAVSLVVRATWYQLLSTGILSTGSDSEVVYGRRRLGTVQLIFTIVRRYV
jgi:hypothetical protein